MGGALILLIIIAGVFYAFKLRGPALKRSLKVYGVGVVLSLGGCLGSLAWLDGETSGNTNFANEVNPYYFAALFGIGVLVLIVNSALNAREWRRSKADSASASLNQSGNSVSTE